MIYDWNELKVKDLKTLEESGLTAIIDGDTHKVIVTEGRL